LHASYEKRTHTVHSIAPRDNLLHDLSHWVMPTLWVHTGFYDGRLVAGADRQHLEHSAGGPQQLLIGEGPHDIHQGLGATAGQDDQLN
jgi:hypothetical protein